VHRGAVLCESGRRPLTLGVDLERGAVTVGSRPAASMEHDDKSEYPLFDCTDLRMLAGLDARRIVLVDAARLDCHVLCPSSVFL